MISKRNIFSAIVAASATLMFGAAFAQDSVKIGFMGDFTGPIQSFTPGILEGAEVAIAQINAQGGIMGKQVELVSGDSACDPTAAANAADRLVNTEKVLATVGPLCSGATISAANNATVPGGIVLVSPSATSPAISTMDDNGLVFRTAPSDAFQGAQMAKLLMASEIGAIAITYVNNDYGKGFADSLSNAFTAMGGKVTANEAHEDGKADYRAELGVLASGGAEVLAVLAYADGSGQTIIRQAIEGGDFAKFIGGDGMPSMTLIEGVGAEELEGMMITQAGSLSGKGKDTFDMIRKDNNMEEGSVYAPNSYDAAFLVALAIEQAQGDSSGIVGALTSVARPPGEAIYPGEWSKAVKLIAAGSDINYQGAAGNHDFDENGDVDGIIEKVVIMNGELVNKGPIM